MILTAGYQIVVAATMEDKVEWDGMVFAVFDTTVKLNGEYK